MVTKRKTRRAAPRRRTYAARRAAPRRRTVKSGVTYIPSALATAALVAVNVNKIKDFYNAASNKGAEATPTKVIKRTFDGITGKNGWVESKVKALVSPDALLMDAAAVAGGYLAGDIIKKYAPGAIKKPLGKIAKKVPKVV